MGGCSALNCCNSGKKGFQMFNFPTNEEQRKRWVLNCKRKDWNPSTTAQLCVVHFEPSQLELKRQDGRRKLKWNAVPTLFDFPIPPIQIDYQRKSSEFKMSLDMDFNVTDAPSDSSVVSVPVTCVSCTELKVEIEKLKRELKEKEEMIEKLCKFLTHE